MYQKMQNRYHEISVQLANIQNKLANMPDGNLFCYKEKAYTKWFLSNSGGRKYLPKKERHAAEQLAVKKYLSLTSEQLQQEKDAIEAYLALHDPTSDKAEQLLDADSAYRELLLPYFRPKSQEIQDWMAESYKHNPNHPETLVHKTKLGFNVRSKSESMIAHFLHANHIPFRYECLLELGETTFYPDFTILHPEKKEFFYWEHFGMMDEPAYSRNACAKLQHYTANGIIPSINLITTYETKKSPLSYEEISFVASHYLL